MQSEPGPEIVGRNIERIIALEKRVTSRITWPESIAETIGSFVGTLSFVGVPLTLIGFWIGVNAGLLRLMRPFDPFPFNFLSTLVSIEAVVPRAETARTPADGDDPPARRSSQLS